MHYFDYIWKILPNFLKKTSMLTNWELLKFLGTYCLTGLGKRVCAADFAATQTLATCLVNNYSETVCDACVSVWWIYVSQFNLRFLYMMENMQMYSFRQKKKILRNFWVRWFVPEIIDIVSWKQWRQKLNSA